MDFIKYKNYCYTFSLIVILSGVVSIISNKGLKMGIDFEGGVLVQVQFKEDVNISDIRNSLDEANLGATVQVIGKPEERQYIIRAKILKEGDKDSIKIIEEQLIKKFGADKVVLPFLKSDFVGPAIGRDLANIAFILIILTWFLILIYISWRFEFKFAFGGIVALIHDALVMVSGFSILGKEVTIPFVAAVLTILGFSINDTIVIYDRIRENLKIYRKDSLYDIINRSVTETLSRTIITTLTVLMTVFILLIFGGSELHDFALALCIGMVSGTYSTVFVASPIIIEWTKPKRNITFIGTAIITSFAYVLMIITRLLGKVLSPNNESSILLFLLMVIFAAFPLLWITLLIMDWLDSRKAIKIPVPSLN